MQVCNVRLQHQDARAEAWQAHKVQPDVEVPSLDVDEQRVDFLRLETARRWDLVGAHARDRYLSDVAVWVPRHELELAAYAVLSKEWSSCFAGPAGIAGESQRVDGVKGLGPWALAYGSPECAVVQAVRRQISLQFLKLSGCGSTSVAFTRGYASKRELICMGKS